MTEPNGPSAAAGGYLNVRGDATPLDDAEQYAEQPTFYGDALGRHQLADASLDAGTPRRGARPQRRRARLSLRREP